MQCRYSAVWVPDGQLLMPGRIDVTSYRELMPLVLELEP